MKYIVQAGTPPFVDYVAKIMWKNKIPVIIERTDDINQALQMRQHVAQKVAMNRIVEGLPDERDDDYVYKVILAPDAAK
jgi:hypothetical protein